MASASGTVAVHRAQYGRKECGPHFRSAAQARLDRVREPRRVAAQEVRMQIDELAVPLREIRSPRSSAAGSYE